MSDRTTPPVTRLSAADSPVVLGDDRLTAAELGIRITRLRTVPLTFEGPRGDTTLDVALDPDRTTVDGADFTAGTGRLHLEGELTLDETPLRCTADVDLATRRGTGRLLASERSTQETV
ncbi:hypothetical protein [Streptomyces coeruleofuscus]|uniref:Uncharacterized protein n=1 Tax=Streptomyces coeruleofuscus TaxID=66879 RepID=A0ABP5V6V0_9ACTN